MPHVSWEQLEQLPENTPLYLFDTKEGSMSKVYFAEIEENCVYLRTNMAQTASSKFNGQIFQLFLSPIPQISRPQLKNLIGANVPIDVYSSEKNASPFLLQSQAAILLDVSDVSVDIKRFDIGQNQWEAVSIPRKTSRFLLASRGNPPFYDESAFNNINMLFLQNILTHYRALHWTYKGPVNTETMLQFLNNAEKYCRLTRPGESETLSLGWMALLPAEPIEYRTYFRSGPEKLAFGGSSVKSHIYPVKWMNDLLLTAFEQVLHHMMSGVFLSGRGPTYWSLEVFTNEICKLLPSTLQVPKLILDPIWSQLTGACLADKASLRYNEQEDSLYTQFITKCADFNDNKKQGCATTNHRISNRIDIFDVEWCVNNYKPQLETCAKLQDQVVEDMHRLAALEKKLRDEKEINEKEKGQVATLEKKLSLSGRLTDHHKIGYYPHPQDTQLPIIWPHEWDKRYLNPEKKHPEKKRISGEYLGYKPDYRKNVYLLSSIYDANHHGEYRCKIQTDESLSNGGDGRGAEWVYFMPIPRRQLQEDSTHVTSSSMENIGFDGDTRSSMENIGFDDSRW